MKALDKVTQTQDVTIPSLCELAKEILADVHDYEDARICFNCHLETMADIADVEYDELRAEVFESNRLRAILNVK